MSKDKKKEEKERLSIASNEGMAMLNFTHFQKCDDKDIVREAYFNLKIGNEKIKNGNFEDICRCSS